MTGSSPKKQCDRIMIGTHDGTFHCDEVLACWMLKQLPKFKRAEIIRTRDAVKLSQCDIVVDVGGIYDPESQRFDHHQRYAIFLFLHFLFGLTILYLSLIHI